MKKKVEIKPEQNGFPLKKKSSTVQIQSAGDRGGSGGGGDMSKSLAPPLAPLNLESYHSKQFWVKCAVCPVNYF